MNEDAIPPIDLTNPLALITGESPQAHEAFLCYFDLGQKRTISWAAQALKGSISTLQVWSSKFCWQKRLAAHRQNLARKRVQVEALAIEQQAALKAQHQQKVFQLSNSYLDRSENLMDQQILTNGENIPVPVILRMAQVGIQLAKLAQSNSETGETQNGAAAGLRAELLELVESLRQQKLLKIAQATPAAPLPSVPENPGVAA